MRAEKNHASKLRFKARYNASIESEEKIGLTTYAFVKGETLALNSVEEIMSHPSHLGKYVDRKNYEITDCHSILCIPLKTQGKAPIGVLKIENTLDQKGRQKFSDTTKECLQLLANIATDAIENFRKQTAKIDNSIDIILLNSLKTEKVSNLAQKLRQIAKTFKEISNATGVSIWLIEGSRLVCKGAAGPNYEDLEGKDYHLTVDISSKKGIGITPWIAFSGETINIKSHQEIISHPQYKGTYDNVLYPDNKNRCESFIGAPLNNGKEIIGVIKADSRIADENHPETYFTTEEAQIFSYLSIITSSIVISAQEFQRTNRHNSQLLALYKLGTECYELENSDEIFWYLLVGLTNGEGIGFNRVTLFEFVNDLNEPSLAGLLALGPRSRAEANKLQNLFDSGKKFDIDFCKSQSNSSQMELNSFIKEKCLSLSQEDALYCYVNQIINGECYPVQQISVENCSQSVQDFLSSIESTNEKIHLFSISDVDEKLYIGICDSMYAHSNSIDNFSRDAANTFINQVSLALSRLSLKKTKEETTEEAWREFTAITAHRIGTETAIISGALKFLKQSLKPLTRSRIHNPWEEDIGDLENSVSNLKHAVREYTEFQKPPKIKRQKIQALRD